MSVYMFYCWHIYMHTHTHIYIYIHTYIHEYIYTCAMCKYVPVLWRQSKSWLVNYVSNYDAKQNSCSYSVVGFTMLSKYRLLVGSEQS